MAIKMLMFDFRESEKEFFQNSKLEDYDITFFTESLNENTLNKISEEDKKNTTVISVFITSYVNDKVLESFPNLMVIATRSTGYNHIDMLECERQNIKVVNVENYGATSVTQFVFGLILCLVRKISIASQDMKKMGGDFNSYVGRDLSQMTIGVIGTGAIGSGVCKIAHSFGMKILANDITQREKLTVEYDVKYVDRDIIFKQADIISLHIPYDPMLRHMVSTKELEKMKLTAWLINVSRGELVDTTALYEALVNRKIAGCALDVVECENLGFYADDFLYALNDTTEDCVKITLLLQKLIEMPNVLITPHIAYDTQDAIDYILKTTMLSIKDNLQGGRTNRIN